MDIRIIDGFVWLIVTHKAKEVFSSGVFELFVLYEDKSEGLVHDYDRLREALECGLDIGIEVGYINM